MNVQTAMEFDNIETLKRAVEIDVGFSLLPAPTVEREVQSGTLAAIPLSNSSSQKSMSRPVGIVHRRGVDLGVTTNRFIQFLLEHPYSKMSSMDQSTAVTATDTAGSC